MSGKDSPTEIGLYRMQSKVSLKTKAGAVVETMHHGEAVRRLHTHAALVAALEAMLKANPPPKPQHLARDNSMERIEQDRRLEADELARQALASATGSAGK